MDFPMDFWLFWIWFINILFWKHCYIKDHLRKHICIIRWCLLCAKEIYRLVPMDFKIYTPPTVTRQLTKSTGYRFWPKLSVWLASLDDAHDWAVGLRGDDLARGHVDVLQLGACFHGLRHVQVHLVAIKVGVVGWGAAERIRNQWVTINCIQKQKNKRRNVTPSDPYVFGPPGSGSESVSQRYGSGSFYHQAKIVRKTLIPTVLWLLIFDKWCKCILNK